MPELEFTIRLNSPAFLGAAPAEWPGDSETSYFPVDPLGLRVPSLRGVLAFWYRSLLGDLDSEEVFRRQATVFGAASRGQGVRIVPTGSAHWTSGEIRPPRDRDIRFLYLGYGPLQLEGSGPGPDGNPRYTISSHAGDRPRDGIDVTPNQPRPQFKFLARGSRYQLVELGRALRLMHLFGGVGGRSRRGWGSVAV
ncbi:MAG: hypothetical protein KDD47_19035, partial [Acidobacteria bacterium]|nr:hypothetical protein [Acidobacteriota bacterium]